jgi:hypothetical protein
VLGPEFVRSAEGLIDLVRDRLAFVCAMIACNRVGDLAALAQSGVCESGRVVLDRDHRRCYDRPHGVKRIAMMSQGPERSKRAGARALELLHGSTDSLIVGELQRGARASTSSPWRCPLSAARSSAST